MEDQKTPTKNISNAHKLFPFIGGRGTQWFGLSSNTVSYIFIDIFLLEFGKRTESLPGSTCKRITHTHIHTRINNDITYIYIYNQVASSHLSKNSCNIAKHLCIWNLLVSWYSFLGSMWVLDQDRRSCWIEFGNLIESARFILTGMMKLMSHLSLAEYFGDNTSVILLLRS